MKSKILKNFPALIFLFYVTNTFTAPPHWEYENSATWWAVEDTSQSAPLSYPFAECGVG